MRNGKKRNRLSEPVTYWESHADLMTALVLVLLLFVMLLLLNLYGLEEELADEFHGVDDIGLHDYISYISHGGRNWDDANDFTGYNHDNGDGGGGGADGDGAHEGDGQYEEIPLPGEDNNGKIAVLVKMVDAETNRVIPREAIPFELFSENGNLMVLHTYYPDKVEYKTYETTAEGSFYLPEKIMAGTYQLQQLQACEGYDISQDIRFWADGDHDWDTPFVVAVNMLPCRNVIRLQMTDRDTGVAVAGSVFDVVAAEDIVTFDGTLRYPKDTVAGTIICDENGNGVSRELYLGEYVLRQTVIPADYVGETADIPVTVAQKGKSNNLTQLRAIASIARIRLTDESNDNRPIAQATYRLTCDTDPTFLQEYTTDYNGSFTVEHLQKNTTYKLVQIDGPWHDTVAQNTEHKLTVDNIGRINGEIQPDINFTNRVIHIRINTVGRLFHRHVDSIALSLYREDTDEPVANWNSSVGELKLDGIAPGNYYIINNYKPEGRWYLEVKDAAGTQTFNYTVMDRTEIALLVIGASLLGALLLVVGRTLSRRKKRKNQRDYEEL